MRAFILGPPVPLPGVARTLSCAPPPFHHSWGGAWQVGVGHSRAEALLWPRLPGSVSRSCHNKLPQIGGLQTIEILSLTRRRPEVQNQGVSRAALPPEALGVDPSCPFQRLVAWALLGLRLSHPRVCPGLQTAYPLRLYLLQGHVSRDLGPTR